MVDKCLRLHLEESMARRPWSTDEFSAVLATHTEMVKTAFDMLASISKNLDLGEYRFVCTNLFLELF